MDVIWAHTAPRSSLLLRKMWPESYARCLGRAMDECSTRLDMLATAVAGVAHAQYAAHGMLRVV